MFGRLANLPRTKRFARLTCPHAGNMTHRFAKLAGRCPSDGALRPSGIDRAGRRHFRCIVCGYHHASL